MTGGQFLWIMGGSVLVIVAVVLFAVWLSLRKSMRYSWPKTLDPKGILFRVDITSCDGCGALLHKEARFKQASTVEAHRYQAYGGIHIGMQPKYEERIAEHYLCFRCQLDETLPSKIAKTIDEAQAGEVVKPC